MRKGYGLHRSRPISRRKEIRVNRHRAGGNGETKVPGSVQEPTSEPAPESTPEPITERISVPEPPAVEADHPDQLTFVPEGESGIKPAEPPAEVPAPRKRGRPRKVKDDKVPAVSAADKALLAEAFDGTFLVLAQALGEHWRLQPAREVEGRKIPSEAAMLADVWTPVLEKYGGKMTGEMIIWLSASTVTVAIVVPRIRQSVQHESGIIGWIKRKMAARRAAR